MSHVRSLLARVQRLEQARAAPRTAFGPLEIWEAEVEQGIDAGNLCPMDMPIVLPSIRRWHNEGLWGQWAKRGQVWNH